MTEAFPAFAVDRAVHYFAASLEKAQDDVSRALPKNASEAMIESSRTDVMNKFLGLVDVSGRYRDPAKGG